MSKGTVERSVDQPGQKTARTGQQSRQIMANWVRELALLPVIILLVIIGAFVNPAFLTANNFINVAQESAALGTVVVAETLILLTGKFDLSLQSTYGLAPMVGAWLIVSRDGQGLGTNWNPFIGIAIVLLVGRLGHRLDLLALGALPEISSGRTRHLRHWWQHRSGTSCGHPGGSNPHRRFHRRWPAGSACWPDDGRAGSGGHSKPGQQPHLLCLCGCSHWRNLSRWWARTHGGRSYRRHFAGTGYKHPGSFADPDILD